MSIINPGIVFSYRESAIDPSLQEYIRKMWVLDNLLNPKPLTEKQLIPNGCFNLAFIFGQGLEMEQQTGTTLLREGIYLCGQFTNTVSIRIRAHTKITLAQLFPWTPAMLTDLPLHEAKDNILPIHDAFPKLNKLISIEELQDEQLVRNFLSKRIASSLANSNQTELVKYCCQLIRDAGGNISIKELAGIIGFSTRFVEKKFKSHVGIRPKEFVTILKVRNLIDELKSSTEKPNLTELAFKYDFYDQAHFIKTFKNILGISPKTFQATNYILPTKGKGI